jgi:hypothetical protein
MALLATSTSVQSIGGQTSFAGYLNICTGFTGDSPTLLATCTSVQAVLERQPRFAGYPLICTNSL